MCWPLALSHDCLFSLTGTKILKKAQAALPKEAQNLSSAALEAPDLNAVSLGKEPMLTAAKAIAWDEVGHGAAEQEGLQELASRRVVEHGMGLGRCQDLADDRPYVAGFGQGPAATSRPAAAKGKNRAASVPAASVATAMDLGDKEVVALPVSRGSRQSVNVELPTAILRNLLEAYLEYVHAVRAEDSQPAEDSPLNQLMTTAWDGLRDTDLVVALRARSFAY